MGKPTVLLGVTGCIAAYKACEILRGLQKADVDVSVVMTERGAEFVGPLTFQALSGSDVAMGPIACPGDPIRHITLAKGCDAFLIAPATADILAKIAHGIADDLLSTTALVAWDKLLIAPAMNASMYEAPATQANLKLLEERGVEIIEPERGHLVCGDVGPGKLADVDDIVERTLARLQRGKRTSPKQDLTGMCVLVTAGPTREAIDAVRYISNPSTGKMGYAVAQAAEARGADVTLISGPVDLDAPRGVHLISVTSAEEMLEACNGPFDRADIAVFTAAVSDMRPVHAFSRKLKKGMDDDALSMIQLEENPDILALCAKRRQKGQYVIGFAAETDDVESNAKSKLEAKGADLIVANDVSDGKGFGREREEVLFVSKAATEAFPEMDKAAIAEAILDFALKSL